MKHLKKLFLILLLIIGVSSVKAERVFDTTIKIYDYAQILNDKEEKDLKKSVDKYIKKYNIDMVLVTIKHYNQNTLEEEPMSFPTNNTLTPVSNVSDSTSTSSAENNINNIPKLGEEPNQEASGESELSNFFR